MTELSRYFRKLPDNVRSRPGPSGFNGANIGSKKRSDAVLLLKSSANLSIPSEKTAISDISSSTRARSKLGSGSSVTKHVDDAYSPCAGQLGTCQQESPFFR